MRDQPSITAAVVASTLLLLRDDGELEHLVDRESLDAVESAVRETMPAAGWALDHIPWPVLKALAFALERAVSPGFVTHYALRKATVRGHLHQAIADGYRQVVLLGSGFDMLSASIPSDVAVFEVDLPATLNAKQRSIRRRAMRALHYLPADLAKTRLRDVLAGAPRFDPERDTVFVAEGLLMYLDASTVERLLSDLVLDRRRTRVIFSFVTPDANGRPRMHSQRAVVDTCMRLLGEEFVWGDTATGIQTQLERSSLRVDNVVSNQQLNDALQRRNERRQAPSSGEVIVVASHGEARERGEHPPSPVFAQR